ncbi:MAG: hypothetical protein M9936_27190 [Caldilinea sp.]|nr:hypothetical protein [Caldilinea sp.]MCB0133657.1 hypothetical protein [Caldilineaceae bacterium]MCO5213404.1 hypothetical protein [Caldilinea sp.]
MRAPHLIRAIIEDFAPHFAPASTLVYAGATGHLVAALLASLGVAVVSHAQMSEVVPTTPQRTGCSWRIPCDKMTR